MTENIFYRGKLKSYKDGSFRLTMYTEKRVKPNHLSIHSSNHISESKETLEENRLKHIYEVKRKLGDYARNNEFDHFWTLTFDPKMCGKDNDYRFTEMADWLRKERKRAKRQGKEFRYIFVPEFHTGSGENGGTIHWHGVTGGYCPRLVDSGKKFKGSKVYNCETWAYGFTNVQKVRSKIKVANYITKYITKDFINSPVRKGKKKYWSSKNLTLPSEKYIDYDMNLAREADFSSDICNIYEISKDEAKKLNLTEFED